MLKLFIGAGVFACYLLAAHALPEHSAQSLLDLVCNENSSVLAEQQLESRGTTDLATRAFLSDKLPLLLLKTKNNNSLVLLAKLAGALRLESTVPALSTLLANGKSKPSTGTTFYQTEELVDDPVAIALVYIGKASVPRVSGLLRAPDIETRSRAVRVLAKIGNPDAVDALRGASETEKNVWIHGLIMSGIQAKSASPSLKE